IVAPTKFSAAPVLGSDNLILAAYGGGPDFSVGWVRSANATMTAKTKTTATEITIIRRPESRSLFSADGWSRPPMQSIVLLAPKRGSGPVTNAGHEPRGTPPTARLRCDRERHNPQSVYAPPTVRPSMRMVGEATEPRNSRSFAISEIWKNISLRFPATVISSTG